MRATFAREMRLNGSLILAWSMLLCACGRDFSLVERDAGMWVDRPLDAGRPPPRDPAVCVGTPAPCAERESTQCYAGCAPGSCRGTPSPCGTASSRSSCEQREGCAWFRERYYDVCDGAPGPCDRHGSDERSCWDNGCDWQPGACAGEAYDCETLSIADCPSVPGCRLVNPPDAGPPDAGPPPAWCSVPGECNPFDFEPCGRLGLCVADEVSGTRCTRLSSSPRGIGESCGSSSACAAGLDCLNFGSGARCRRQCPAGSTRTCGADSRCVLGGIDRGGCIDYCSYVGPTCDDVRQNCGTGLACYVFHDPDLGGPSTLCGNAGTVPIGSACAFINDCVRGASCLSSVCRESCDTNADCSTGTCSVAIDGSTTLRSCL